MSVSRIEDDGNSDQAAAVQGFAVEFLQFHVRKFAMKAAAFSLLSVLAIPGCFIRGPSPSAIMPHFRSGDRKIIHHYVISNLELQKNGSTESYKGNSHFIPQKLRRQLSEPVPKKRGAKDGANDTSSHIISHTGEDVSQIEWKPEEYPDPRKEPIRCGLKALRNETDPPESPRLCDPDRILSHLYLEEIEDSLLVFNSRDSRTTDISGPDVGQNDLQGDAKIELGVALVRKMAINTTRSLDFADAFSEYLLDSWWKRTGDIASRNEFSILIFFGYEDGICVLCYGSMVASIIPRWKLGDIMSAMESDLRQRLYGHAILTAIADLSDMIAQDDSPSQSAAEDDAEITRFIIWPFVVLALAFRVCWKKVMQSRGENPGYSMSKAERDRAMTLQKGYNTKCCPICLDPFDSEDAKDDPDSFDSDKDNGEGKEDLIEGEGEERSGPNESFWNLGAKQDIVDLDGVELLRCGHIFCKTCCESWTRSGNTTCPVCRNDIRECPPGASTPNDSTRLLSGIQSTSYNSVGTTQSLNEAPLSSPIGRTVSSRESRHHWRNLRGSRALPSDREYRRTVDRSYRTNGSMFGFGFGSTRSPSERSTANASLSSSQGTPSRGRGRSGRDARPHLGPGFGWRR